ncbi:hypothetical protein P171DRAFT_74974 [Karstenula rhodostoma CBS 690.94]|uniref:CFEM domain-containing protein n=1 Tax=Karstenula rhodostoma CBS 690.94 TaxID=1392251 RepID=A0A9P4PEC5_9PLEO|nr:hypothetical protein P171DRAFT_74974 [Karstenula rhodostoma CBS 690.94]
MRYGRVLGIGLFLWSCVAFTAIAETGLPQCASTCVQTALANQNDCSVGETTCICSSEKINAAIYECVKNTCTVKESLLATKLQNIQCNAPIRDRSKVLLTISIVIGVTALIAVCIRMSVAARQANFGWDDVACLAAYAASVPVTVVCCVTSVHGFGKDTWASPVEDIFLTLKLVYASQISYFPASGLTKLCFLLFFLRIFPGKRVQRAIHALIWATIVYIVVFTITMVFACKPISAIWTSWTKESTPSYCINQKAFYYVAAGCNIALDILVVLIPIPELLKLKLSRRRKIFLVAIFSVGAVTVIISCIRLGALATYETEVNPMYNNVLSGVWSVLEINVGIICICMPSFPRFVSQLAPHFFGTTQRDSCLYGDIGTPNACGRNGRKKNATHLSMFDMSIVKTVDMTVEAQRASDDEVRLVVLQQTRTGAPSSTGSADGNWETPMQVPDRVYDGRS